MHAGHHGPPPMPYGSPAMGMQQPHGRGGSSGPDSGHMVGRIGSSSSGGPPPGIGAMGGAGMLPPHALPHMLDGPGSGPNSGSAGGPVAGFSPHPQPGNAAHPHPHAMQPAPPVSRGGEGNSSFSQGPPSGSHAIAGGLPDSSGAPGGNNQGQPGPHAMFGPPHGPGGMPHPSMSMSSGAMHPGVMQAAMMPMPMMPPMMANIQGQPVMMPYPGGPQGPGGMMMVNAAGGAFMMSGMQPPYMYMAGPGIPPGSSAQARPNFYPQGAYPMPMSPGGSVMRPPSAAGQQQGQHADGPMSHGTGGPGTPTAPSPHGGMGRTPASGNRDRQRGPRGQGGLQHEKRGSAGDGHGLNVKAGSGGSMGGPASAGSVPVTPPGVADGDAGGAASNGELRKDEQ